MFQPEGAESQKEEEAAEMSPELESKFLKLMESTRLEFECTRQALASVQEHVDLLKKHSKELLFDALVANLVAMMCDAAVCSWITTTRFNREFKWDVKQAPREAPDSDC